MNETPTSSGAPEARLQDTTPPALTAVISGLLVEGSLAIHGRHRGMIWCTTPTTASFDAFGHVPLDQLSLDLGVAAGRDRAVRWLSAQIGGGPPPLGCCFVIGRHNGRNRPIGWGLLTHDWNHGEEATWWWTDEHSFLAGLDPNDPRTLPDGSRWVDAEALRRVVLHVAGWPA